jgi:hypothetical protein
MERRHGRGRDSLVQRDHNQRVTQQITPKNNRTPGGRNFAESAPFIVHSDNSNRQFIRHSRSANVAPMPLFIYI